jgi:DNA helicase-2/ATP-dependent DNA helicase PcrA
MSRSANQNPALPFGTGSGQSASASPREKKEKMDALLLKLNDQQRQAVTHTEGPVLIVAGAGSGKTRVLTHRIAYLLQMERARPDQILALTFTNKAAAEMRERISALIDDTASTVWMGTFHSVFSKILRGEADKIRLGEYSLSSGYSILDTNASESQIKLILEELKRDPKQFPPRMIRNAISTAKNQLIGPAEYRLRSGDTTFQRVISDVYERYAVELVKMNSMDFDDLLVKPIDLFRDHPEVLEKYQQKFRYILIDEYQDTNHAQYVVTKQLAGAHKNLCVVGDDAQSIYSFRGADISNILDFKKDYPEAMEIPLEVNYRSTKRILQCADSVIKRNDARLEKTLRTNNAEGEPIILLENFDERDEANRVAQHIRDVQYRDGIKFNEMAVLFRTNYQSRVLEEAFRGRDIPHQVVGGLSFYDRKEIKDTLGYMTLLVNPRNNVALHRVINVPSRGIGKKTLNELLAKASSKNMPLWTALADTEGLGIRPQAVSAIREFRDLIVELQGDLAGGVSISKVFAKLMQRSGYLNAMKGEHDFDLQARRDNIQELQNAISYYETYSKNPTLQSYLQELSLFSDTDKYDENKPTVALMTIHASKGLEFSAVWIVGMEENLFPIAPREGEEPNLEEERRLMYVAITRAKKRLFFSHCKQRRKFGEEQVQLRSRFLDEVDAGVVRTESGATIRQKQGSFGHGSGFGGRVDGISGGLRGGMNGHAGSGGYGMGSAGMGSSLGDSEPGDIDNDHDWRSPLPNRRPGISRSPSRRIEYDHEPEEFAPYVVGAEVMHTKFGKGKIIQRENLGWETKVVVFFRTHGNKTMRLRAAKLQVL